MHKEKGYKQVADWHDVCAEYHTLARDAFHLWCLNSRPRSGPICQLMRSKRAQFKSAVRKCKEIREQNESDRLAQKLLTLTLPGPSAGVSGSLDSYCSLKPLCSGMGEVVPARTSPTLLPSSPRTVLSLSCFKVSQCFNCRDWHC